MFYLYYVNPTTSNTRIVKLSEGLCSNKSIFVIQFCIYTLLNKLTYDISLENMYADVSQDYAFA